MSFKWDLFWYPRRFILKILKRTRVLSFVERNTIFFRLYCCLLGLLFAFSIWKIIIVNMGLHVDVTYILLILALVFLGIGFTFSEKVRCITFLTCLGLFSRSGRSFLRALAFSLIISGPIMNLGLNGKEVIRTFSCSTILTYNLTKTRFDLMTKPFYHALMGMRENLSSIRGTFNESTDILKPIIHEIEDPDYWEASESTISRREVYNQVSNDSDFEAEHYQRRYSEKLRERCERQMRRGRDKCKKAFLTAFEHCKEKLPAVVNLLLCWPMKITVVCKIKLWSNKDICDPSKVLDPSLGENYANLKRVEEKLKSNLSKVDLEYKLLAPQKIEGLVSAKNTSEAIIRSFAEKKSMFDYCMYVTKKILAFVSLKVVIAAIIYHNNYLRNIEYDNFYLTSYFDKIEERRKERGQRGLMPLKKLERSVLINVKESRRSKLEKRSLVAHLLKFMLELVTACFFILLDIAISTLLEIVAKTAKIEYKQEGEHIVNIIVNGTGIIASLIKSTLKGFNIKTEISTTLSNESCLPRPSRLSTWYYLKMTLIYSGLAILIYYEVFILRLRRLICSHFYPKREKQRILYTYNSLLKRRRALFNTMRDVVTDEVQRGNLKLRYNLLLYLRLKCSKYFGWLRRFSVARRTCLVCRELEPTKFDSERPLNFADCQTKDCYFVHCEECWTDIGKTCLACGEIYE